MMKLSNMDSTLKLLLLLGFILLITLSVSLSPFGNIEGIMDSRYPDRVGGNSCLTEGRLTPSGHLPGSWIMLTDQERKEMLRTFVENGQPI